MRLVLRRALPVLMAALALASTGCGSKSSERSPTGPRPPEPFGDDGRVRSMSEPYLGTAANFAILAGTPNITCNVGGTVVGDLGISPAAAIIGFGGAPCTDIGTSHAADAVAVTAKNDLTTAFGTLAGLSCSSNVGPDLVGLTLVSGVYCVSAAATNLSGLLQLDAQGNPNAVWVFKMSSSLITSPNSTVSVINGGSGCGVQWLVNSSATIDVNTTFVGNIVALTSIVLNGGATLNPGRALARNGSVTLNNNTISQAACLAAVVPPPFPGGAGGPGGVPALPYGMEWVLFALLVGIGAYTLSRR
jgi:hypothetical protein